MAVALACLKARVLIGLHPDQATDHIVDVAISLGKPLQKQSGIPEDQQVDDATVNMDFAKDWIQKIFETPREHVGEKDIEAGKNDAFRWLQENFGPGAATNRSARRSDAIEDSENRPPVLA